MSPCQSRYDTIWAKSCACWVIIQVLHFSIGRYLNGQPKITQLAWVAECGILAANSICTCYFESQGTIFMKWSPGKRSSSKSKIHQRNISYILKFLLKSWFAILHVGERGRLLKILSLLLIHKDETRRLIKMHVKTSVCQNQLVFI